MSELQKLLTEAREFQKEWHNRDRESVADLLDNVDRLTSLYAVSATDPIAFREALELTIVVWVAQRKECSEVWKRWNEKVG